VCPPCRYNAATPGAQGVDDRQLAVVNGAKGNDPDLAVFAAFVGTLQDRALEDSNGVLEIDSVLGDIGRVLGSVSLKRHLSIDAL
jgi:hypothetical protein